MSSESNRSAILIAIIGGVASIIAALIGRWENIPPSSSTSNSDLPTLNSPSSQQPKSDDLPISKNSRFYCELQPDFQRGGDIWTVIYRSSKGDKPWLRMVRSMGDGWDTKSRCEEISRRLDIYASDGLIEFKYRSDPETPNQFVICAKTKKNGTNCPLVLTLLPQDDPVTELREVAAALLPDSLPSYQCSDSQLCPEQRYEIVIKLESRL
jgi:hypothetical protein